MTHPTHIPVLVHEVVMHLAPQAGETILDATVGAGGHAAALLNAQGTEGMLVGLDIDPQALDAALVRLQQFGSRVRLLQANYSDAAQVFADQLPGIRPQRILLDLGVSSLELEASGKGFSFQKEGEPLDLRFGTTGETAARFLARASADELTYALRTYGEEPLAHGIAQAIIRARRDRPLRTVGDLVPLIVGAYKHRGFQRSRRHPATRTFQALRIAVNDELGHLERGLPALLDLLTPGGRMAVISFHSLEDRIVKQRFQREARDCICPPELPVCQCGHTATIRILTKHVVSAAPEEQATNPRSRSAKLRVIEKIQRTP